MQSSNNIRVLQIAVEQNTTKAQNPNFKEMWTLCKTLTK